MEVRITEQGRVSRDAAGLQHILMLLLDVAEPQEIADILWAVRNALRYAEIKEGAHQSLSPGEIIRGIHRESELVNSPPSPGRPSKVNAWLDQLRGASSDELHEKEENVARVLAAAEKDLSRTSFWRLRKRAAAEGLVPSSDAGLPASDLESE